MRAHKNPTDITNVYIAADTRFKNTFKVGRTSNVFKRQSSLQTGNPDLIIIYWCRLPVYCEKLMHEALRRYHTKKEWFECSFRLIANCLEQLEKLYFAGKLQPPRMTAAQLRAQQLKQQRKREMWLSGRTGLPWLDNPRLCY
jgi:hypothetical protein